MSSWIEWKLVFLKLFCISINIIIIIVVLRLTLSLLNAIFLRKNELFLLKNTSNLTHELLYDNFNKKNLTVFLLFLIFKYTVSCKNIEYIQALEFFLSKFHDYFLSQNLSINFCNGYWNIWIQYNKQYIILYTYNNKL